MLTSWKRMWITTNITLVYDVITCPHSRKKSNVIQLGSFDFIFQWNHFIRRYLKFYLVTKIFSICIYIIRFCYLWNLIKFLFGYMIKNSFLTSKPNYTAIIKFDNDIKLNLVKKETKFLIYSLLFLFREN